MKKLIIHTLGHLYPISQDDILYCQSDNCYTHIHFADEKELLISHSLAKFSKELDTEIFIRVSQSYLINKNFIRSVDKKKKLVELISTFQIHFTCSVKELLQMLGFYGIIISVIF